MAAQVARLTLAFVGEQAIGLLAHEGGHQLLHLHSMSKGPVVVPYLLAPNMRLLVVAAAALDKLKAPLRQLALRRMLHATSISWNSSATNGFTTFQSTARASTPSNLRGNLCSI